MRSKKKKNQSIEMVVSSQWLFRLLFSSVERGPHSRLSQSEKRKHTHHDALLRKTRKEERGKKETKALFLSISLLEREKNEE